MGFVQRLIAGLFRRHRVESEMAQELRFHMESRAADLERRGLSPAEAKREARAKGLSDSEIDAELRAWRTE